jgi:hypothetical protein
MGPVRKISHWWYSDFNMRVRKKDIEAGRGLS